MNHKAWLIPHLWRRLGLRLGPLGRIRLHPLFLLLVLAAVGVGLWKDILVLFLLVMLHELGHAMTAEWFGYQVEEVSILPFGGVAKLAYGNIGFTPSHEAAIAVAGPLVNLVLAVFSYGMYLVGLCSVDFFHYLVEINLWIAAFNLLPGLPLDGGRVYRAARARKVGYEAATREAYTMSVWISALLLVIGGLAMWAGTPHLAILVLGVFLLVSALTGRRDVSMDTVRFLDSKARRGRAKPEPVRALAASGKSTVKEVVRQFAPDRYHMVYVLGENGTVKTILEEEELLEAVFAGKWLDSLDTWVRRE